MKNTLNRIAIAILVLMIGSFAALAHNGTEHIMGTVTAVSETSITVNTVKNVSVTLVIDSNTKFTKNDSPAARTVVKVGERVAINAKEAADKRLVATTVKIGSSEKMDHGSHKK